MGDSRAPGKDREAVAKASAAALTSEKSPSSRPSGPVSVKSSIPARPVVSVIPQAKVTSTAPPATEDIDSEWPDEPVASEPSTGSLAPATDEVDSGWLGDEASAVEPPPTRHFPSDPALPSELWGAEDAQSRRGSSDSRPPARSAKDASPLSESSQAEVAKPRAAEPARESIRVSTPPPRSRGKTLVLAAAAVVAAGFWFTRGGNRSSEEPGVQAARPEAALTVPAAEPTPPAEPPLAAHPEASAASPAGVEAPSAAAVAPAVSANAQDPSPAPGASADASSGKIVVIVNVRPPHARIYYRGKEAGKAPLRVELEPGKRRAFEVGSPGFMTRKIVVDGSKPEILVGLRPASPYASSPPPAAP